MTSRAVAHVYVMAMGEQIKIGKSEMPWRRLEGMRHQHRHLGLVLTYCTDLLEKAVLVEARAHQLLSHRRVDGEWFAASPDDGEQAIKAAIVDVRKEWKFPPLYVRRGMPRHRDALAEAMDRLPRKDWPDRWR